MSEESFEYDLLNSSYFKKNMELKEAQKESDKITTSSIKEELKHYNEQINKLIQSQKDVKSKSRK